MPTVKSFACLEVYASLILNKNSFFKVAVSPVYLNYVSFVNCNMDKLAPVQALMRIVCHLVDIFKAPSGEWYLDRKLYGVGCFQMSFKPFK